MFSHNDSSDHYDTENEGLLISLVLAITNAFSCCHRSQKQQDEPATYVDKPCHKVIPEKKGLFATSFDQIPCDGPIFDYQYRTGRRYVTGDNFPRTNDLDIYLTRQKSLVSIQSNGSLNLATEANLDFHILADQFVDLFAQVSAFQVEKLRSQFPNEVAYFLEHGERLTSLVVKQEFTKDGAENLEALQEIVEILRGMNMKVFFHVLSQGASSIFSSNLSEEQSDIPFLTPARVPSAVKPQQWFDECSDRSDSGESLEGPALQITENEMEIDTSLKGFSPIEVDCKHHSAVEMFEEWAALQSPCFSPCPI